MKLEPVYVLGSKPQPPSMPTRRAVLLAGAAFALGAGSGYFSSQALGRRTGSAPAATEPPPTTSLDPRLQWLHEQCEDRTPVATLLANRAWLFQFLPRYPDDPILWHGMSRAIREILDNDQAPDRRRVAQELTATLEFGPTAPDHLQRERSIAALRAIARGR